MIPNFNRLADCPVGLVLDAAVTFSLFGWSLLLQGTVLNQGDTCDICTDMLN